MKGKRWALYRKAMERGEAGVDWRRRSGAVFRTTDVVLNQSRGDLTGMLS